jgi:predicted kinase
VAHEPANRSVAPHVVLMCGIAGSGKTTYAIDLEAKGYVRLSIDEEVWHRFGCYGIDYPPSLYGEHSTAAERVLAARLVKLVQDGQDVVVDFSFWRRSQRDRYRRLVTTAGGRCDVIYLKADAQALRRRLAVRSRRFDANAAFPITEEVLVRYLASFEEPHGAGETVIASG